MKTWNSYKKQYEDYVDISRKVYNKSYTDTSKYRPNVSNLIGAESTKDIVGQYDFYNGEKNADESLFVMRNKGADIVELQNYADKKINEGKLAKQEINNKVLNELEKSKSELKNGENNVDTTATESE